MTSNVTENNVICGWLGGRLGGFAIAGVQRAELFLTLLACNEAGGGGEQEPGRARGWGAGGAARHPRRGRWRRRRRRWCQGS